MRSSFPPWRSISLNWTDSPRNVRTFRIRLAKQFKRKGAAISRYISNAELIPIWWCHGAIPKRGENDDGTENDTPNMYLKPKCRWQANYGTQKDMKPNIHVCIHKLPNNKGNTQHSKAIETFHCLFEGSCKCTTKTAKAFIRKSSRIKYEYHLPSCG